MLCGDFRVFSNFQLCIRGNGGMRGVRPPKRITGAWCGGAPKIEPKIGNLMPPAPIGKVQYTCSLLATPKRSLRSYIPTSMGTALEQKKQCSGEGAGSGDLVSSP